MAFYEDEDEWGMLCLGQVITTDCCATIHKACKRGHVDCLRSFIDQEANLEERHDMYHNTRTPIITATVNEHTDCIRILVENGVNVNSADNNGETSLHRACKTGYFDGVDILIKAGANNHIKDCYGYTAFHNAARKGNIDCLRALFDSGLDVNLHVIPPHQYGLTKGHDETALHLAIYSLNTECIKFLIAQGANLDSQDKFGSTPLHYAVQSDFPKGAKLLLDAGANPLLMDKKQRTPKDLVIKYHNKHLKDAFIKYCNVDTSDFLVQFQQLLSFYEMELIKEPDAQ